MRQNAADHAGHGFDPAFRAAKAALAWEPMPWVDVDEPFAKPPRIRLTDPQVAWSGSLELDRGWGEVADFSVGRNSGFDLSGCTELTVTDSVFNGIDRVEPGMVFEVRRSAFSNCDLSRSRVSSVHVGRFDGCKFTGTDLSGAVLQDVQFLRCSFRHANLRMARLLRVQFVDCALDDVDCFELHAEDVEFPGCALDEVNVDRLSASRVDLRGATALSLAGIDSMSGCLIGEHQVPALAYSLAFAVGVGVERSEYDPTEST